MAFRLIAKQLHQQQ